MNSSWFPARMIFPPTLQLALQQQWPPRQKISQRVTECEVPEGKKKPQRVQKEEWCEQEYSITCSKKNNGKCHSRVVVIAGCGSHRAETCGCTVSWSMGPGPSVMLKHVFSFGCQMRFLISALHWCGCVGRDTLRASTSVVESNLSVHKIRWLHLIR